MAVLSFALVGVTGNAMAPTISGVPDIVIGPDDEAGLTVGTNFFQYLNALNLLNHVSDSDSTIDSDVQFVFLEENSYNNVDLNAFTQLDLSAGGNSADATTWGPYEFTNFAGGAGARNFMVSFRDILRSPRSGGSGPFPDPGGTTGDLLGWQTDEANPATISGDSRGISLFAADNQDNIGSTSLLVYSVVGGTDDLSGGFTTIFSDPFLNNNQTPTNWTYATLEPAMGAATSGIGAGFLSMTAGATGTGSVTGIPPGDYGRWQQNRLEAPALPGSGVLIEGQIPYAAGNIVYVARFTLAHDATLRMDAPNIRIGLENSINYQVVQNNLGGSYDGNSANDAAMNPQLPDANTPTVFEVLLGQNSDGDNFANLDDTSGPTGADLRNYVAYFEIFDQNRGIQERAGTWTLTNFDVVTIDEPGAVTPTLTITDFRTSNGFIDIEPTTGGNVITATRGSSNEVTFNDAGQANDTDPVEGDFYLLSRNNTIGWTSGNLIRCSVTMACPTQTARDNFHRFRIRHNVVLNQLSQEYFLIHSTVGGEARFGDPGLPTASPGTTTYDVYVPHYGGETAFLDAIDPNLLGGQDAGLWQFNLDMLNNVGEPGNPAEVTSNLPTSLTITQATFETLSASIIP
jgi:hypothetical protein